MRFLNTFAVSPFSVLLAVTSLLLVNPLTTHAAPSGDGGGSNAMYATPTPMPQMDSVSGGSPDNQLTIQDSNGFTRAASSVETTGNVEFTLVDAAGAPAEGAEVSLVNAATGEVVTAQSVGGTVVFSNVAPGVWTVSTTASGVTFTNVAIVNALAAAGATAGLGTAALVVGGAGATAGAAIAISDATDGDSSDLSPAS